MTLQLIRLRQERVGAAVSGAAAVQHQRAVQRLRQVLLRPAIAVRVQQPQLPPGAAQQRQGPETRGEIQLHVCAHKTNMTTLGGLKSQTCCITKKFCKERLYNPTLSLIPNVFYAKLKRVTSMTEKHLKPFSMSSVQAISRLCDDKYKEARRAARKRSASVDHLCGIRWVPAILS